MSASLLKFQNLCFLSLVFKLISNTNNFLLLFGFELKLFHLTTNKYNIFLDWIYRGHFLLKCISVCMVIFDTIAYKSFWRLLLLNQYIQEEYVLVVSCSPVAAACKSLLGVPPIPMGARFYEFETHHHIL